MFIRAYSLSLSLSLSLFFCPPSPRLLRTLYPERDLNPHKHYCSQDFKSCVSTIPPSGQNYILLSQYSQKTSPACRTLSRLSGNSTIRAIAGLQPYNLLPAANLNKYVNLLRGLASLIPLSQVPLIGSLHHRQQHNTSSRDR